MVQEKKKDEMTLTQFLEAVAEGSATPGGGSVSALAGSLGAALVEMVVNLTLGKKGFEAQEAELKKIRQEVRSHREALAATIVQDIKAYQEVMIAYLLPKTSEEEKRKRKEEIQKSLKKAADPPLFTAATSLKVMKLCQEAVEKGNPNTISDAAIGVLLADAALLGGIFNVLINLSALDDKTYVEKMKKELRRLRLEGEKIKKSILGRVKEKIY
ncbi:MAG: cyclodeaminase/cyclohydrolase family protein [Deltaproteobacteria bacterium]|nr:cyclodeaminase/cyclohydrolase family protein [Deltaproteobacteria bacterium]